MKINNKQVLNISYLYLQSSNHLLHFSYRLKRKRISEEYPEILNKILKSFFKLKLIFFIDNTSIIIVVLIKEYIIIIFV